MGRRRVYIRDVNWVTYLGDVYSGVLYMGGVLTGLIVFEKTIFR